MSELRRDLLPGVTVKWQASSKVDYNYKAKNMPFIRLANIVHTVGNTEAVWSLVKEERREWMELEYYSEDGCTSCKPCRNSTLRDNIIDSIENKLGLNMSEIRVLNISDADLRMSGEMYIYLIFCPWDKIKEIFVS